DSDPLFDGAGGYGLIGREKHTRFEANGFVKKEARRADEDGPCTPAGLDVGQASGGSILRSRLDEESQVRLAGFRAQRRRPVAVDARGQSSFAKTVAPAAHQK